jgi:hypothetical protein
MNERGRAVARASATPATTSRGGDAHQTAETRVIGALYPGLAARRMPGAALTPPSR